MSRNPDEGWLREVTILFPPPARGGAPKAFAVDAYGPTGDTADPARDVSLLHAAILILNRAGYTDLAGLCAERVTQDQVAAQAALLAPAEVAAPPVVEAEAEIVLPPKKGKKDGVDKL